MAFFILVYYPWGLSSGILLVGPAGWYIPDGPGEVLGVGPSGPGGNLVVGPAGWYIPVGPGGIVVVGPSGPGGNLGMV